MTTTETVTVDVRVWDEHQEMLELLASARRMLTTSDPYDPTAWVEAADTILAEYE